VLVLDYLVSVPFRITLFRIHDRNQVRNLSHHTANRGSVDTGHNLIETLETETLYDQLVFWGVPMALRKYLMRNIASCFVPSMFIIPRPACREALRPRMPPSAFQPGEGSLHHVMGIRAPRDLVSMLEIPADCTTARTGPPAITPVPSDAA